MKISREEKIQRLITREYGYLARVLNSYKDGTLGEGEAMYCITETIAYLIEKYENPKNVSRGI